MLLLTIGFLVFGFHNMPALSLHAICTIFSDQAKLRDFLINFVACIVVPSVLIFGFHSMPCIQFVPSFWSGQVWEFPAKLCSLYRCPKCTDIFVINKNTLLSYFGIHTVNILPFLLLGSVGPLNFKICFKLITLLYNWPCMKYPSWYIAVPNWAGR